jgi:hypothetical protein
MPGCTCELLSLISSQQREPARRLEIIPYRGHKHCFQSILPAARQRAGYLPIIPSPRPARGFRSLVDPVCVYAPRRRIGGRITRLSLRDVRLRDVRERSERTRGGSRYSRYSRISGESRARIDHKGGLRSGDWPRGRDSALDRSKQTESSRSKGQFDVIEQGSANPNEERSSTCHSVTAEYRNRD